MKENNCAYILQRIYDGGLIPPKLAKEWNYDKNEELLPENYLRGSRQVV